MENDPYFAGHSPDKPKSIPRFYGLGMALKLLLLLASIGAAYFILMAVAGFIFWSAASGLIDEEIPAAVAQTELAGRLERSFGVTLDTDWRILRARDMRAKFQGDGHKWFLVQLPHGRMSDFEASLVAADRLTDRNPGRPIVITKPGPGEDADDWSKYIPKGTRTYQARDAYHDLVMVHGDQFFVHLNVP